MIVIWQILVEKTTGSERTERIESFTIFNDRFRLNIGLWTRVLLARVIILKTSYVVCNKQSVGRVTEGFSWFYTVKSFSPGENYYRSLAFIERILDRPFVLHRNIYLFVSYFVGYAQLPGEGFNSFTVGF